LPWFLQQSDFWEFPVCIAYMSERSILHFCSSLRLAAFLSEQFGIFTNYMMRVSKMVMGIRYIRMIL
jgi:hypothetical protein